MERSYSSNYKRQTRHTGKPNNKVVHDNKVYIGIFVFFAFVIYISGYVYTYLSKPAINVEIAQYGTIEMPKSFRGIIVRDELVVNASMSGELVYEHNEKDRVKKESLVAKIKNTENADLEKQIAKIDADILRKQKDRLDISFFSADVNFINGRIKKLIDSNLSKINSNNASNIYQMKQQLQKELDKRNTILFSDTQSSLVELIDEKTSYENQLSKNTGFHLAPASGILSFNIDGFENIFTIEQIQNLSEEQTKMNISIYPNQQQITTKAQEPIFKIVTSNNWYIASYIPNTTVEGWDIGDIKDVYISSEDGDRRISTVVSVLTPGINDTYVVFQASKGLIDFLDVRSVQFEVRENIYEGIKIPSSAIIEKAMLSIPNDFIITQAEEGGVIKKGDIADEFIIINSRSIGDDTENSYVFQDMRGLKIGDVIKKSNAVDAETYILSDIVTVKGVYVVNSSITEFKQIGEILIGNGDYTIIRSNSIYDVQVYDRIVSDAKSINDSEMIY